MIPAPAAAVRNIRIVAERTVSLLLLSQNEQKGIAMLTLDPIKNALPQGREALQKLGQSL